MFADIRIRLRSLFHRRAVEGEIDDELRFHFERQVEKFVASGLPLAEARRRARLTIGGQDQIKEEYRDSSGVRFLETLAQDVRFSLRMLRKSRASPPSRSSLLLSASVRTLPFSAWWMACCWPPCLIRSPTGW